MQKPSHRFTVFALFSRRSQPPLFVPLRRSNMAVITQDGVVLDDKENRLLDQAIKILEQSVDIVILLEWVSNLI
jgi:hypothetical protein